MYLKEIRGKKANKVRWDALRMLDWEKDYDVIERIFASTNPQFFSSNTPADVIRLIRDDIEWDKLYDAARKARDDERDQNAPL